jgi:hypothetical protein
MGVAGMITRNIVSFAIGALAVAIPAVGADGVSWGSTVNGLRLGIGFGPASLDRELRVFLQNSGSETQEVIAGRSTGRGMAVDFKFLATAPDGKKFEGFEIHSFTPVTGLVLPAVIRLDPGASHEWRFPLKTIICIEKTGDVTFDSLVKLRSSMRVSLEMYEDLAGNESIRWLGKVASGQLSPVE